jgi:hypothetical protein
LCGGSGSGSLISLSSMASELFIAQVQGGEMMQSFTPIAHLLWRRCSRAWDRVGRSIACAQHGVHSNFRFDALVGNPKQIGSGQDYSAQLRIVGACHSCLNVRLQTQT